MRCELHFFWATKTKTLGALYELLVLCLRFPLSLPDHLILMLRRLLFKPTRKTRSFYLESIYMPEKVTNYEVYFFYSCLSRIC